MKRLLLVGLTCLSVSSLAYAADVTPADVMPAEVAHEQQVQTQLELLQQARDAAFIKQLEAEALMMEQQGVASPATPPASPAP